MQTHENSWSQFDWHEVMQDMQELGKNIRNEMLAKYKSPTLPAINIQETNKGYFLAIFLAGYAKENLKLSWEGYAMTIKAFPAEADLEANYVLQEYPIELIERTLDLPTDTEPERMEAKFEHGILRIFLPKTLPAQNEVEIG